MPRIFDNIDRDFLPALRETVTISDRADFCVGYFNLRGWKGLSSSFEKWNPSAGQVCRLLVGMQSLPQEELQELFSAGSLPSGMDNQTALRLKKDLLERFREQLTWGYPTEEDERALRALVGQLKAGVLKIRLFLEYRLHAKLYLFHRKDPVNPVIGYVGSSNLTMAGLSGQGELNIDVVEGDAADKLSSWFEERWINKWCLDITADLVKVIEESWASERTVPPYLVYLKMAWHLSREAREGVSSFRLDPEWENKLFKFQQAAVKIAAHHILRRGGVLLGDVVGLGKTVMASAIAKLFEEEYDWETLIICPKNLEGMWNDYREAWHLRGQVLSLSRVLEELPNLRRFRLVIIDESHNLRNREGQRYAVLKDYIARHDAKCVLLSATPYNRNYQDLASQLRLFFEADRELPVRPEFLIRDTGEQEFLRQHQCPIRSLAAFEKSEYAEDWRELMRFFMVRRTRSFIIRNYACTDKTNSRKYLESDKGDRYYFPIRVPKTLPFPLKPGTKTDQYASLYSPAVVDLIGSLCLPRYGLGNYTGKAAQPAPTKEEAELLDNLSRAGKRLMGFCRTNLFKRLESSGQSFLLSLERHVMRNFVYLHAVENGLDLPVGTQDADLLTSGDTDEEEIYFTGAEPVERADKLTADYFKTKSARIYQGYKTHGRNRFDWIPSRFFTEELRKDLKKDAEALLSVLKESGPWRPEEDTKLAKLAGIAAKTHKTEKILVFSQFADTVRYLEEQLKAVCGSSVRGVTGTDDNPALSAWRFSPVSNGKREQVPARDEIRVLIATDVLSEGQNLQDCSIVVNYDLPWAIIRLVQRAGRVDRIGQDAEQVLCYSFLPADGVEEIIGLRGRVLQRLKENAEVVGTDEAFFEDETARKALRDLFTEKAGILDGDQDGEVDLCSEAFQIWKNATQKDPVLEKSVAELADVVYSTKSSVDSEEGVLVFLRTAGDNDALVRVDPSGKVVTESPSEILEAARCEPETAGLPRLPIHHELVAKAVKSVVQRELNASGGGQLGRPSGVRYKTYERLKRYVETVRDSLFEQKEADQALEEILKYPLKESARVILARILKTRVEDGEFVRKVLTLKEADALSSRSFASRSGSPRIICSLGLKSK